MSHFPAYDRHVHIDGKNLRLKVEVSATTRCGPPIRGEHVVRLRTLAERETRSATTLATSFAVSKLKQAHDAVVRACRNHNRH